MQMPTIDVKPLVWKAWNDCLWQSGGYQIEDNGPEWGAERFAIRHTDINNPAFIGRELYLSAAQSAANAHHAAQVRSQVAGVTLTDDEARKIANEVSDAPTRAHEVIAVQAAFAAMGAGE
jgi:hypothetical protein